VYSAEGPESGFWEYPKEAPMLKQGNVYAWCIKSSISSKNVFSSLKYFYIGYGSVRDGASVYEMLDRVLSDRAEYNTIKLAGLSPTGRIFINGVNAGTEELSKYLVRILERKLIIKSVGRRAK